MAKLLIADDEEIILSADTIGSDERGFDSISQFLKEYISRNEN